MLSHTTILPTLDELTRTSRRRQFRPPEWLLWHSYFVSWNLFWSPYLLPWCRAPEGNKWQSPSLWQRSTLRRRGNPPHDREIPVSWVHIFIYVFKVCPLCSFSSVAKKHSSWGRHRPLRFTLSATLRSNRRSLKTGDVFLRGQTANATGPNPSSFGRSMLC